MAAESARCPVRGMGFLPVFLLETESHSQPALSCVLVSVFRFLVPASVCLSVFLLPALPSSGLPSCFREVLLVLLVARVIVSGSAFSWCFWCLRLCLRLDFQRITSF